MKAENRQESVINAAEPGSSLSASRLSQTRPTVVWFANQPPKRHGSRVRVLAITQRVYLGDIYLTLQREGHEVRVFAAEPGGRAFTGLIATVADWRAELDWVGRDGVILFEGVQQGAVQDELRAAGYRVAGGSAYGDRLENDRDFGQATLQEAGLQIAPSRAFDDAGAARQWLGEHPGRYVLKHDHGLYPTFVGEHPDGADVIFRLGRSPPGRVLLMQCLDGVEVGIGGYFDGSRFLQPACIDFEHKRFFPGDMGEMTGEMGTLASYRHAGPLFDATLARMAGRLAAAGHVGYLNLNLIVNEAGVWPLEFTCRIGNPGFAVLAALQTDGWGDLFARMAAGQGGTFHTAPGWSVAIVLTIPPFPAPAVPCVPDDDHPVFFRTPPGPDDADGYHYVDMRRDGDGQLLVHKRSGHAMIVTGTGVSVAAAQDAARRRARNVLCPELRWRGDIGDRFVATDAARLQDLGWLPADLAP